MADKAAIFTGAGTMAAVLLDDASEFLDGIDRLGRKLRERLGESLGSIRETVPLERATTTLIEALRKYTRADQAFDARDLDQAIALLDEAIALNSTTRTPSYSCGSPPLGSA